MSKTLRRSDPSTQPRRRCTAHKSTTGEPCKNAPIKGGTVCRFHGAAKGTPARAKAEQQLRLARDELMELLLGIARDSTQSANDRLKAITWALERAGFRSGSDINVELSTPAWQKAVKRAFKGWGEEEDEQSQQ
jgi:hypothetical protein